MIRFFDIVLSLLRILLLSPVLLFFYIAIYLESKGGGFYKQLRVGQYGRDFCVYKFRSMRMEVDKKGPITVGGRNPRIARTGYFIRKYRLGELPQLFDVLKSGMSLVEPWPGVRKYVDLYTDDRKKVLNVRPGITDYASIGYVDENAILGRASDPDKAYIEQIMPDKIRYNMRYICNRPMREYFKIILLTFWSITHQIRF